MQSFFFLLKTSGRKIKERKNTEKPTKVMIVKNYKGENKERYK